MFGLRQKLALGFGGLLLILLLVSALGIAVLRQHRAALDKFLYENWRSVEYSQNMIDADADIVVEARKGARRQGLVAGLVLGVRKAPPRNTKREREQLLAALESLELAHRDGTVGPKTYERGRRELLDDIARTFAADPTLAKSAKPARRKAAS